MASYVHLADVYEFLTPEPLLTPEGNVEAFAPWLPAGGRVLDCACGVGLLAAGLAARGYTVDASDLSPEMVARTRRARSDTRRCRAWEDLEPGPRYDAVFCVGNSLAHAADRRRALAAMAATLNPGGTVIVTSRNWERERALGSRLEIADRLTVRGGRSALVSYAWHWEEPLVADVAVSVLDGDAVHTVQERLTVFPFTYEVLLADLRAAGLDLADSTYSTKAERYLVSARVP